jgi:hypothetical protein
MKRSARLRSAVSWLKKFAGKSVLRGYCKHFGVDWRCAAIELRQLGVHLDSEYLKRREVSEQQLCNARKKRRESQVEEKLSERWYGYESTFETYLAEDYPALYAMECERDSVLS